MTGHEYTEGCPAAPAGPPESGPTVAIVDDHLLLSEGIRAALVAAGFSVVVPEMTDIGSIAGALEQASPAVALLDLDLGPVGNGQDLVPALVAQGTRVLVVTGTDDASVIGGCLQAGAWGWIPKASAVEDLVAAIRQTAAGEPVMGAADRDQLVRVGRQRRAEAEQALEPFDALTRREGEVLSMLREGKSVERIAAESFVSEATVRSQVRAILSKLGVNNQLGAVAKAIRAGWSPERESG